MGRSLKQTIVVPKRVDGRVEIASPPLSLGFKISLRSEEVLILINNKWAGKTLTSGVKRECGCCQLNRTLLIDHMR